MCSAKRRFHPGRLQRIIFWRMLHGRFFWAQLYQSYDLRRSWESLYKRGLVLPEYSRTGKEDVELRLTQEGRDVAHEFVKYEPHLDWDLEPDHERY